MTTSSRPSPPNDPALANLIAQAESLAGQTGDPKLKLLTDHLGTLIADGFNPVVFCRYIATAHYLGRHLEGRFAGVTVSVVTGELTADERKEQVELIGDAERRLSIATDCLSEGINLQDHFDAVVHYDLSWNPTRHEQREGRVDRFGQPRDTVRATLLYGENNPVDGAVLRGDPAQGRDDPRASWACRCRCRTTAIADAGADARGLAAQAGDDRAAGRPRLRRDRGGAAASTRIWVDAAEKAKQQPHGLRAAPAQARGRAARVASYARRHRQQ